MGRYRGPRMVGDACNVLVRLTGIGCCPSCVEDGAEGDGLVELETPNRRFWAEVCCDHATEPDEDEARRTWWAILLRESRRRSRPGGHKEGK